MFELSMTLSSMQITSSSSNTDTFETPLTVRLREVSVLRYVYTLRLIGPISYLGACYIYVRIYKVTKCIREKMTMCFRK